jgi:hypothetical protein
VLPERSWALKRTVAECRARLAPLNVTIKSVRSSLGDAIAGDELGEVDSAWLLKGTAIALGKAESVLLRG